MVEKNSSVEACQLAFRHLQSNLPYPSSLDASAAAYLVKAVLGSLTLTPSMMAAAWDKIDQEKKRKGIARLGPGPGFTEFWDAALAAAIKEIK